MSNALQEYFPEAEIPFHKEIRFHPNLTFGEKMFYAEIDSLCNQNEKGICPYSSRKLCELFNISHQTILTWIKKLVELELLEVGIDVTKKECKQYLKIKSKK